MDKEAWNAAVHGVAKSRTRLSNNRAELMRRSKASKGWLVNSYPTSLCISGIVLQPIMVPLCLYEAKHKAHPRLKKIALRGSTTNDIIYNEMSERSLKGGDMV